MSNVDSQKIEEILSRGVERIIDKDRLTERLLKGDKLRIKFGIDPTSSNLHLGHLIILKKLSQLQKLGHQIIFLIGDFTAKIGDPSGRSETRKILTDAEVKQNMKDYIEQADKILDIKKTEIRYNSEWYDKKDAAFFMEISMRFTVARLLEREDFKKRFAENSDITLLEIIYPLLQGYDSLVLKSDLEIGGSDQEFNLFFGRKVQKKYGQIEQDIMTISLLEGTDGIHKMSKSYGNAINLTDEPNDMYGKIMSIPDKILWRYFTLLTDVPLSEIDDLKQQVQENDLNPRDIKIRLAKEIITGLYNQQEAKKSGEEFNRVFSQKEKPTDMPEVKIKDKKLPVLDLLMQVKIVSSKSEAQRLIEQKGIKVNDKIIEDWREIIEIENNMIIQAGKRRFVRVIVD